MGKGALGIHEPAPSLVLSEQGMDTALISWLGPMPIAGIPSFVPWEDWHSGEYLAVGDGALAQGAPFKSVG